MSTHLMNFNIPKPLKADLDRLSRFKNVSKTSIILGLIEEYCRRETKLMLESERVRREILNAEIIRVESRYEAEAEEPPMPIFDAEDRWEVGYQIVD